MRSNKSKWWMIGVAFILLSPALLTAQHSDKKRGCDARDHDRKCRQVPEGSSNAIYVVTAGAACLGAMLVRSRLAKS